MSSLKYRNLKTISVSFSYLIKSKLEDFVKGDKFKKVGEVLLKIIIKKGKRDLFYYALPFLVGSIGINGETVEHFREIIALFFDQDDNPSA